MDESKLISGFSEHEKWFTSHKRSIIIESIVFLIENTIEEEYTQEDMINDLINEDKFTDFICEKLYTLNKDEIIESFKKYISKYIKDYETYKS